MMTVVTVVTVMTVMTVVSSGNVRMAAVIGHNNCNNQNGNNDSYKYIYKWRHSNYRRWKKLKLVGAYLNSSGSTVVNFHSFFILIFQNGHGSFLQWVCKLHD